MNTKKFTAPVRVGSNNGNPSETDAGTLFYDSAANTLKYRDNVGYNPVLKAVSDDPTPSLGGNLDVGTNSIVSTTGDVTISSNNAAVNLLSMDGVRRASPGAPTDYIEDQYIHSILFLASQTNVVIPELTFDSAVFDSVHLSYKIKDSLGAIRTGAIVIASDGTVANIFDGPTIETAPVNISFNVQMNLSLVEVIYTSGTETAEMRVDIKRIQV